MIAALRAESLKLSRSLVGVIATFSIVLGMIALLGGITAGVAGGNPQLIARAGPAAALNWNGLLAGAAQIAAVATLLGFGIVLAWIFGREFSDGTITGLFALPVSRTDIALAKITVYLLWAMVVSLAVVLGVLALGLLMGYGIPGGEVWAALARIWALAMFSAGIAIPVAWIATLTRSLLAAVASTIALIVVGQVGALTGAGGWIPLAAPALWAMSGGPTVSGAQLSLAVGFAAVFTALACWSWSRLQLNR